MSKFWMMRNNIRAGKNIRTSRPGQALEEGDMLSSGLMQMGSQGLFKRPKLEDFGSNSMFITCQLFDLGQVI